MKSPDQLRLEEFEQYRGLLFSIAYRMLGSVTDAEDLLQETYLRWRQATDPQIRSTRSFLVTIVSRLCINHLQSARVRREQYVGEWLPQPLMTGPGSDPLASVMIDESLSTAFLVMLERLTPAERAVFLLREVFGYEYSEVADVVGQSEINCRQIFRRARSHIDAERPRFQVSLRKQSDLLERFLQATVSGDLDGLVSVLAQDVVLHADGGGKAIAVPNQIFGADYVARAILGGVRKFAPDNLAPRIERINGEPGVVLYLDGKPYAVFTVDAAEESIRAIYFVTNPEKISHVPDLPENSR